MIRSPRPSALGAALSLAVACASPTADVTAPAEASVTQGVIASATGGGTAELPAGFGVLAFTFAAHQHAQGRGLGTFQQARTRNGLTVEFRGRVTCVSVDAANARAWIGGVVTENASTDPNFQTAIHQPGRDVWFRVVDNGEGSDAAADRTTVLGFTGAAGIQTSAEYCATRPWPAGDVNTFPVIGGNVAVH